MPKKKLTKTQVKNKLRIANNQIYDLMLDKLGHADSKVPISQNKLLELNNITVRAAQRLMR